ncbi:MAG: hypothetical protein GEU28_03710 [Dehalococcoidia bacterium]|nr:hypothetical protein [Dehalococcoidia bacterium]
MSDFLFALLVFAALFNPAGGALVWRSVRRIAADPSDLDQGDPDNSVGATTRSYPEVLPGVALAVVLLAIAALLGDGVIDLLDTSPSSFAVASGLLLILWAARLILQRRPFALDPSPPSAWLPALRMAGWLATPAALAIAAYHGADIGVGRTILAVAVAAAGVGVASALTERVASRTHLLALREAGRLVAAVLVVLAVVLIVDGVQTV